jgi:hypothetical protein
MGSMAGDGVDSICIILFYPDTVVDAAVTPKFLQCGECSWKATQVIIAGIEGQALWWLRSKQGDSCFPVTPILSRRSSPGDSQRGEAEGG